MIWRDDDVLMDDRGLDALLLVDDLLQQFGQLHTVAVIAETLTPAVAAVLRERRMSAQVHCWRHDDLSVDVAARAQLSDAVRAIADAVGVRPTVLYPPWNRTSPALEAVAAELGLRVDPVKVSLEQVIRAPGAVRHATVNFHYWHPPDRAALAIALVASCERIR